MKYSLILIVLLLTAACSEKSFSTVAECRDFVKKNSATAEKLSAGLYSCRAIFNEIKDQNKKSQAFLFGQCVINDLSSIHDDTSGTKIVSLCGDKSGAMEIARYVALNFSQAHRIANQLEAQQLEMEILAKQRLSISSPTISNEPPAPIIINDSSGNLLKTCMAAGSIVHCD